MELATTHPIDPENDMSTAEKLARRKLSLLQLPGPRQRQPRLQGDGLRRYLGDGVNVAARLEGDPMYPMSCRCT
jgi:hypothetical protein